jgi:uncharacterized membrane protein YbhN (UPF0104 family)
MGRTVWAWLRPVGALVLLAILVWRLGTGPIRDGVRTVDARSLAAAAVIALLTTVGCAWRWGLVARGLGVAVPLRTAVAAYYRSQFLNTTLPGGVVGDVHRAVNHGREVGDVGRGLRAVAWERGAGQAVQVFVAVAVLLLLPSPVRSAAPLAAGALVGVAAGALLLSRVLAARRAGTPQPAGAPSRLARVVRAAGTDLRTGLLARRAWPGILIASAVVVAGHTATFVIAARTAGASAPLSRLLPLALLVLLAMGIPVNIGGWGPREGVAAWAFGAAGLGAGVGLATAVVYGVLVLVASLPGAAVLLVGWLRRRPPATEAAHGPAAPAAHELSGAARG